MTTDLLTRTRTLATDLARLLNDALPTDADWAMDERAGMALLDLADAMTQAEKALQAEPLCQYLGRWPAEPQRCTAPDPQPAKKALTLRPADWETLTHMQKKPDADATVNDIAETFRISHGAAYQRLRNLYLCGMVTRRQVPQSSEHMYRVAS